MWDWEEWNLNGKGLSSVALHLQYQVGTVL